MIEENNAIFKKAWEWNWMPCRLYLCLIILLPFSNLGNWFLDTNSPYWLADLIIGAANFSYFIKKNSNNLWTTYKQIYKLFAGVNIKIIDNTGFLFCQDYQFKLYFLFYKWILILLLDQLVGLFCNFFDRTVLSETSFSKFPGGISQLFDSRFLQGPVVFGVISKDTS